MKFRSRLFGFLALLSLLWICYGVYASSSAFSQVVSATSRHPGRSTHKQPTLHARQAQGLVRGWD